MIKIYPIILFIKLELLLLIANLYYYYYNKEPLTIKNKDINTLLYKIKYLSNK